MRIERLDLKRFGCFTDCTLDLSAPGTHLIVGLNEAGKTTLMRFIRSTLYGYEPLSTEPAWHQPDAEQPWRGALRCEHGGRTWRIHRRAELTGRGRLRISGGQEGVEKETALNNILAGTSEDVYADIFAVGVRELNQLATLGTNQVAEYIYGLSLGPQGRQILDALAEIKERRKSMFGADNRSGRMPRLFDTYAGMAGPRRNSGQARDKHAKLTRRRRELLQENDELQHRESIVRNELRGLRFLQNCHKPWKR